MNVTREHTVWTTIGEVIEPFVEQGPPNGTADFCYVDISSIDNACKRIVDPKILPASNAPTRARQHLRLGDVLVSMTRPNLNAVAIVPDELENAIGSTGFCVLRPIEIIPSFFFYLVQTEDFVSAMSMLVQGALYPAVRPRNIFEYKFRLPPLSEQRRIVAKIEELFSKLAAGVEELRKAQVQLKRYRQAMLQAAVSGQLTREWREARKHELEPASELLGRIRKQRRMKWEQDQIAKMSAAGKKPIDAEWKNKYIEPPQCEAVDLKNLPYLWVWARAEQVCDFITKGTTPSASKLFASGEIPYIKVYNLTDRGTLDFSIKPTFVARSTHAGELARSRVFPGDVLMNIVGPPLGKVSLVTGPFAEWNINQAIAIFRSMPSFDRKYLVLCLLAKDIQIWAERRAKATAGQFNLTLEICRDLPLPLPPLFEQQKIVDTVERCVSIAEAIEQVIKNTLKQCERMRYSILRDAFEGKLVPQDSNEEPAELLLERIKIERAKLEAEKDAKAKSNRKRLTSKRTKRTERPAA